MSSTVLVTGASSGIGLATAVAFAERGDRVFASVRDQVGEHAVRRAATGASVYVDTVRFDVADDALVRRGVDEVVAAAGGIDVLVNNAGVSYVGAVETMPDDQWRELFDVNVLGVVRVTRAVLPTMRAAGSGVVVNVTSVNGRVVGPFGGAYGATKFAVEALSEALVHEVEPFGIRVTVVQPGQFDTPIFAKMRGAAVLDPASPYAEGEAAMLARSIPTEGAGADPRVAAAVIVAAATGERPGFRHPAGADAEQLLGQRARFDDEEWIDVVRRLLAERR